MDKTTGDFAEVFSTLSRYAMGENDPMTAQPVTDVEIDIPPPESSPWHRLKFDEVRVLFLLPDGRPHASEVHLTLTKGAASEFFLHNGVDMRTFVHEPVSYNISYDSSCRIVGEKASVKSPFVNYSPYGEWTIKLRENTPVAGLKDVTRIQFLFHTLYLNASTVANVRTIFADGDARKIQPEDVDMSAICLLPVNMDARSLSSAHDSQTHICRTRILPTYPR